MQVLLTECNLSPRLNHWLTPFGFSEGVVKGDLSSSFLQEVDEFSLFLWLGSEAKETLINVLKKTVYDAGMD